MSRDERRPSVGEQIVESLKQFTDDLERGEPAMVTTVIGDLLHLPPDVSDAADALNLAILRHKLNGWSEISADGMLSVLWLLMRLAVRAPGGAWVEEPTSGCNKIAPGHKAYIVTNQDDVRESEGE